MEEIENTDQNIKSTRVLKIAIFIMTLLLIIGFCVVSSSYGDFPLEWVEVGSVLGIT